MHWFVFPLLVCCVLPISPVHAGEPRKMKNANTCLDWYCYGEYLAEAAVVSITDHTGSDNYEDNSVCIWFFLPITSSPNVPLRFNVTFLSLEYLFGTVMLTILPNSCKIMPQYMME